MKKNEYQKFQDFKQKYNLTNKQIATIMTEYANTEDEYSANFFVVKYHISEYVFFKMRDFTIIFMLVSAEVCRLIRNKAFRNQSGKNKSGNYTSANRHYRQLIEKRKEYLRSFPDEEVTEIALEYANGDALYDITKKHCLSTYTVQKLLAIVLANHLVCDQIYFGIKSRSDIYIHHILKNYSGYTAEELWNNYSHWK